MSIRSVCTKYFDSFSAINDQNASKKKKTAAKICILSCLLVLPPVIFGIGYALSTLAHCFKKIKNKVSKHAQQNNSSIASTKTWKQFFQTVFTKPEQIPGFIDTLNTGTYQFNGMPIIIPPAGMPTKFTRQGATLGESLTAMKAQYATDNTPPLQMQFKDRTTEEAIAESNAFSIALNFANEHHAGGGPGFHKDKTTNLFVYDGPSARAQEESLCQRSNLMCSLTQLLHYLQNDFFGYMIRSYYNSPFDSTNMAYVSSNHLFAVQDSSPGKDFYDSQFLPQPKPVVFVTSAATSYGEENNINCNKGSSVYIDAKQRIETHLLAAADKAGAVKQSAPNQPVELILGAFGCGAFAPEGNPNEYRAMIANIYRELLPQFNGFFDTVTFAVPTFGRLDPAAPNLRNPAIANYVIFKNELGL